MTIELWLYYFSAFFIIILARYFLIAGGTYWWFYSLNQNLKRRKSEKILSSHSRNAINKDIILSISTALALAICSALVMTVYDSGATRLYSSLDEYGTAYLVLSFIGVLLLQDSCFYFLHRGFHHPLLYKWFHRGHHRSKHPTPWTSFALDFPEALAQGLFLVGVVFVIPLNIYVLGLLLITMTVWALVNHLGFELFPSFSHHWLGKCFISSDRHSLHHRNYSRHYGLYFTFWDRLLGTN